MVPDVKENRKLSAANSKRRGKHLLGPMPRRGEWIRPAPPPPHHLRHLPQAATNVRRARRREADLHLLVYQAAKDEKVVRIVSQSDNQEKAKSTSAAYDEVSKVARIDSTRSMQDLKQQLEESLLPLLAWMWVKPSAEEEAAQLFLAAPPGYCEDVSYRTVSHGFPDKGFV